MDREQELLNLSEEAFDEVKNASIEIWKTYDNTYGYRDEKVNAIKDLKNESSAVWYMIGMFDSSNRGKLLSRVSSETALEILKVMEL
jgi:CheY-specific phosphatase CheX